MNYQTEEAILEMNKSLLEIEKSLLEVKSSLKSLVNLKKFEMQNKYIASLQKSGIHSKEIEIRVDGYGKTLQEIACKDEKK